MKPWKPLIFFHFGLFWMLLYLVKILPNNWAIDSPTENIPNNLAVGELGNLWLVNSCWAILFTQATNGRLAFKLPNISWANFNQKFSGQYVFQCWLIYFLFFCPTLLRVHVKSFNSNDSQGYVLFLALIWKSSLI